MEARPFHLSPTGPDIISKQKGQWFCHELGHGEKKKKNRKPKVIIPFGTGRFFSDVKIYVFLNFLL